MQPEEATLEEFLNVSLRKKTSRNLPRCIVFKHTRPVDAAFNDAWSTKYYYCTWACVAGEKFCSKHMGFNQFTVDQLPYLRFCNGCHKFFLPDSSYVSCNACRSNQQNTYQEQTKDKTPCQFIDPLKPDFTCRALAVDRQFCNTHGSLVTPTNVDKPCERIGYGCTNPRTEGSQCCDSCKTEYDLFHQTSILVQPLKQSKCGKCHRNFNSFLTKNKTESARCMSCAKIQQAGEVRRSRNQGR